MCVCVRACVCVCVHVVYVHVYLGVFVSTKNVSFAIILATEPCLCLFMFVPTKECFTLFRKQTRSSSSAIVYFVFIVRYPCTHAIVFTQGKSRAQECCKILIMKTNI